MRRGNRTMSNKVHSCPTCARLCDEAKDKSKRLEKKVYAMTIALTSALTLLGEKAVQEIMSMVRGMENITDSGGGESTGNEVGTSSTSAEGSTPRTRPFIHEQSTTTDSPAQDEAKGKSNTEGISDTRKAPKVLMDVVNGRIPSMGELVEMPAAPAVQPPRRRTSETYADDVISYSDYEIIDPNARFVTDSPFGGYDFESNHGTVPAPATVVVLGIVPLLGRRRQR